MCRFIAYLGIPLVLHDVLFKPTNSLIKQSYRARETEEKLNGDGFGLAWYVHNIDNKPALFKSIQPAWNDKNLQNLSEKILSDCFFAHVRAASNGSVNVLNTHPFAYKNLTFMHNGDIGQFEKIKRPLRALLNDDIYAWVQGQTDSEHFFALFLHLFYQKEQPFDANTVAKVLRETIKLIESLQKTHQVTEPSYINAVISDGKISVAIRYVSDNKLEPSSLHYSVGSRYEYHNDGHCHMLPVEEGINGAVLIASETLSGTKAEWQIVPANHLLLIYNDLTVKLEPL